MTVYFVRPVGECGPVKIGCAESPKARMWALDAGSPVALELAATCPGMESVERQFHAKFYDLHLRREWFNWSPELELVIEQLNAGVFSVSELPPPYLPHGGRNLPRSKAA